MSVRVLALLTLVLPAFAGCLGSPVETAAIPETPAVLSPVLFHDGLGGILPAAPAGLEDGFEVALRHLGHRGGEPNVGVTSSGAVFVTAGHATLRSRDRGATWEEVFNLSEAMPQPPSPGNALTRSSDPMLWVDPWTDRVFTNHMTSLLCSNMIVSDDEGSTWTMKPMTCGLPVNDHQKVATAPWREPKPPAATFPTAVYYCYNKVYATHCAVSLDGGLTFAWDRPAAVRATDGCGGINGHPAPAPDGTMYVPLNLGCSAPAVAVTEDNGLTWTVRHGPDDHGAREIDPEITVTPDGTAYMLWRGADHLQYLARSADKFVTWEGPWRVSPPNVTSTVFAGLTSGDDGRIAAAYLGTGDTDAYPQDAPAETRWNLYVTYSLDAASGDPSFATVQANPDEDPVQVGCVWLSGGSGGDRRCRNLLDFIDMTRDLDGRIYVAITDGCTEGCSGVAGVDEMESRRRDGAVAVLARGPSLFAEKGSLGP